MMDSKLNKDFANNHGDLRGQSAGEYYPFDVMAVGEYWVVVDYRLNVDNQIAEAREHGDLWHTPHGAEWSLKKGLESGKYVR